MIPDEGVETSAAECVSFEAGHGVYSGQFPD